MDDALVKELRGDHTESKDYSTITEKYIRERVASRLNSIDAVIIMYTDCKFSQEVVRL
jgi:hypothetical protein